MTSIPRPGAVFGGFEITRELGRGASGVVHAAVQLGLGREVALKLLSPELVGDDSHRRRFEREAQALARIDSPHVIGVHAAGVEDGRPWIATTLVPDGSLTDLLHQGPVDLATATDLVAQVASGVAAAHAVGVLHRDIKPSNVLVRRTPDGLQAVVCDLGIALEADAEHTRTGGVIGTWAYLAPERLEGADATVASDVYALGCLLHAVLTGHAPYGGTEAQVAMAHLQRPIPQLPPGRSTPALEAVLQRAMAKRPQDRFATAEEMVEALRAARTADGGAGVTPSAATMFPRAAARPPRLPGPAEQSRVTSHVPRTPTPTRRRGPLVAVLAVVAVLVLVGLGVVVVRQVTGDDPGPGAPSASTAAEPAPVVDDPAGGLSVGGAVGDAVEVEVTGTLPAGAETLVVGEGAALAEGSQALVNFWIGDAQGQVLTDTYTGAAPAVLPVSAQPVFPYLAPLSGAAIGTRFRYVATVTDALGADYAAQLGVQPTDTVVVVVDVLADVLDASSGEAVTPETWVPLVSGTGDAVTGFSFRPTDKPPDQARLAYLTRGDGPEVAADDDVALRFLVQDLLADAPTTSTFADPLPGAISLASDEAAGSLGQQLVGVPVGSRVVVELPATGSGAATVYLVDVLGAG